MKVIHKYTLAHVPVQTVAIREGSDILHIGMQYGAICIWVLSDPDTFDNELRQFELYGTGTPFDLAEGLGYIGTVQDNSSPPSELAWHIFERTSE